MHSNYKVYIAVHRGSRLCSRNTCALRKIHLGLFSHKNCYKLAARGTEGHKKSTKVDACIYHNDNQNILQ